MSLEVNIMNKRKFEKLLKNNIESPHKFSDINQQIDYSQYSNKKSHRNIFVSFLLNKKKMAIVCTLLLFIIFIPLVNKFKDNASNINSNVKSLSSCTLVSQETMLSSLEESSSENLESSNEVADFESSENQDIRIDNLILIAIDGIIKYDEENNNKKFYTDKTFDDSLLDEYIGFYNLNDLIIKNYRIEDDKIMYSFGSEVLGVDLPINTKCHAKIVIGIDGESSEYNIRDVYSIEHIIF